MKTNVRLLLFVVTFLLMLTFTGNLIAQNQPLNTITKKGEIRQDETKLGHVDSSGVIYNAKGEKVGKTDPRGIVTNASGKKIGE